MHVPPLDNGEKISKIELSKHIVVVNPKPFKLLSDKTSSTKNKISLTTPKCSSMAPFGIPVILLDDYLLFLSIEVPVEPEVYKI